MSTKPVSEMTPSEYALAKTRSAWRGAPPPPAVPPAASPPPASTSSSAAPPRPGHHSRRPALDMTDAEFAVAKAARAWNHS
jgi:hypothetical protein